MAQEPQAASAQGAVHVEAIPAAATVVEAAHLLRSSRSRIYELMEQGELRSFSLGRKRLISGESIAALIRAREHQVYTPTCTVAAATCAA